MNAKSISWFLLGAAVAVAAFRTISERRYVLVNRAGKVEEDPAFWLGQLMLTPALPAKCPPQRIHVLKNEPIADIYVGTEDDPLDAMLADAIARRQQDKEFILAWKLFKSERMGLHA